MGQPEANGANGGGGGGGGGGGTINLLVLYFVQLRHAQREQDLLELLLVQLNSTEQWPCTPAVPKHDLRQLSSSERTSPRLLQQSGPGWFLKRNNQ